jgi:hypothetical protein
MKLNVHQVLLLTVTLAASVLPIPVGHRTIPLVQSLDSITQFVESSVQKPDSDPSLFADGSDPFPGSKRKPVASGAEG